MDKPRFIEIPFGADDSELKGWEYTIPEGFEAEIKDGKVVVREKETEDETTRKWLINAIQEDIEDYLFDDEGLVKAEAAVTWLKNLKPVWTRKDDNFVVHILPRILDPHNWSLEQQGADKEMLVEFINSFRDRYDKQTTWKPTEEQMGCLNAAMGAFAEGSKGRKMLQSLYDDLATNFPST